jgi:hypothetical protein
MKTICSFEIYGNTNDTYYDVPITGTLSHRARIYVEFCATLFSNAQTPPGVIGIESLDCLNQNYMSYNGTSLSTLGNICFVQANTSLNVFNNYGEKASTMGVPVANVLQNRRIHLRFRDFQGLLLTQAETPEFKIKFIIVDYE